MKDLSTQLPSPRSVGTDPNSIESSIRNSIHAVTQRDSNYKWSWLYWLAASTNSEFTNRFDESVVIWVTHFCEDALIIVQNKGNL